MPIPIKIPAQKIYDEDTATFYDVKETTIHLEHSLLAISKWEAKWKKPFLDAKTEKSIEEIMDYIRCMCIESEDDVDPIIWKALSRQEVRRIENYISDKMTASTVTQREQKRASSKKQQVITSELLYYYMSELKIPFSCEMWHLGRLMMLIQIASVSQQPNKKMPKGANISQRKALNASRKKRLGTRG